MLEAMRAQLVRQGYPQAAHWTKDQLLRHLDSHWLMKVKVLEPERFHVEVVDFMEGVQENLMTINALLQNTHVKGDWP